MVSDLRRADDILAEVSGGRRNSGPPPPGKDARSVVTRIFEDILGLDIVDPESPFGKIGGESLLAVRILARCKRALDVELPLRSLGPSVTFNQFVDTVLAVQQDTSAPADAFGREVAEDAEVFRVPAGTAGLVSLHELNAGSPLYSVAVDLVLIGSLKPERLRAAIAALVQRHDSLRLTFSVVEGGISAHIEADPVIDYADLDGSGADGSDDPARIHHLVCGVAREPLDLKRSPLRVRLVRESVDRHHLVLVVHHAVCDGISLRILLRDLTTLYRDGTADALPVLEAGAAELARREAARLTAARLAALTERWSARLAGAPELLQLPVEDDRPSRQSLTGNRLPLSLPAGLRSRLQELAADHDISLFSMLSSALAITLRRYTGQTDIVIGIPVSGRPDSASQDVVANLARMVPLRLLLDGLETADLLAHAQNALMAAHEDCDLPFNAIVQAARQRRTLSYHPIFQVTLTLLLGADELAEIPGLDIVRQELETGTAKFDMSWYLEESGDALNGYVEYADLFPRVLAEQISGHFVQVLESLAERPCWGRDRLPVANMIRNSGLAFGSRPAVRSTESRWGT
jgi:hypothetical protein